MVNLLDVRPKRSVIHRPPRVCVNGVHIPAQTIAREMQNHDAAASGDAWMKAARALVVRELLLQEARRLGIEAQPICDAQGRRETEEEALIRMVVAQEVQTPKPQEAECQRYFAANRRRFRTPPLFEVRHILLSADPADPAATQAARETAQTLIAQLETSPHLFADLAALHSTCPSAATEGSLGQIGPGQTVPEFEDLLATLPVGKVAPNPIATRFGMHVVIVDRHIEGRDLPFELVHARIADWLSERVQRTAVHQYLRLLAGRARIEGIELDAAPSPLLQ